MNQTEKCVPHRNDSDEVKQVGLIEQTNISIGQINSRLYELKEKLNDLDVRIFGCKDPDYDNIDACEKDPVTCPNFEITDGFRFANDKLDIIFNILNELNYKL